MKLYTRTDGRRVFLWRTVSRLGEDRVTFGPVEELLGELPAEDAIAIARQLLAAVPSDCCEACGTLKPIPRAAVTFGAVEAQSYAPPRKEPPK